MIWAASVLSVLRNFRRAGTALNKWATSTRVPWGMPQSRTCISFPPLINNSVPFRACGVRVLKWNRDTLAMEGRASPRNPKVSMLSRSSASLTLLVACLSMASRASSGLIPEPLSSIRTRERPPFLNSISTLVAAASRLFSQQFLDHCSRSFNHFASGDLIGYAVGKNSNLRHKGIGG